MKMINAKITITYTCPMLVKDESEMLEVFEQNRKEIMGGFEIDASAEIDIDAISWTEDCQVFAKNNIYLDMNDARGVLNFTEGRII
jgi:hypothetical protein